MESKIPCCTVYIINYNMLITGYFEAKMGPMGIKTEYLKESDMKKA